MESIIYQREPQLSPEEFLVMLKESTLAERRPVDEPDRIADMARYANLVITARAGTRLVGVARSLTDYAFCTYLSDLAVSLGYQKLGIGKELIRQTKLLTPRAMLILLSAPAAVGFYTRINMEAFGNCFVLRDLDRLEP